MISHSTYNHIRKYISIYKLIYSHIYNVRFSLSLSLSLYIYIYMYTHTHIYIYIYIYIYILYIYSIENSSSQKEKQYTNIYICMYVCMYVYVSEWFSLLTFTILDTYFYLYFCRPVPPSHLHTLPLSSASAFHF